MIADVKTERNAIEHVVSIAAGRVNLPGDLCIPKEARGVVLFAHGSGSSRHSPRNRLVARALQAHGLATLLFDLLTPTEEAEEVARLASDWFGRYLVEAADQEVYASSE